MSILGLKVGHVGNQPGYSFFVIVNNLTSSNSLPKMKILTRSLQCSLAMPVCTHDLKSACGRRFIGTYFQKLHRYILQISDISSVFISLPGNNIKMPIFLINIKISALQKEKFSNYDFFRLIFRGRSEHHISLILSLCHY